MTTKSRLTKLEAALAALPKPKPCHWCRGPKGEVGGLPLLIFADDPDNLAPYGQDGRCHLCGALAPAPTIIPPIDFGDLVRPEPHLLRRKLQRVVLLQEMACKRTG